METYVIALFQFSNCYALHISVQIENEEEPINYHINYLTWTSCGSSAAILASLVYSILVHISAG